MLSNSDLRSAKFQQITENYQLLNNNVATKEMTYQRILESLLHCTQGESASILLKKIPENILQFEYSLGVDSAELSDFSISCSEGIAGWVVQNNRSLIVNDIDQDNRFYPKIAEIIGYQTQSILASPIREWDKCIGVVEVVNKKDSSIFTEEDRNWAEIIANQIGLLQLQRKLQKPENFSEQNGGTANRIIYSSPVMENLLNMIHRIAQSDATVFINGESGVGKELVAEEIHRQSKRASQKMVKVNCPSLPELLLESELFGHVKGAFTDAVRNRQGKLEIAEGGSLFLDEITEIPLSVQVKLLRFLENKQYEPLGSNQVKTSDIRIISASNRNISKEIQLGNFREDLFYRLNIIPVTVPPLRQRKEDIPVLAESFIKTICTKLGRPKYELSTESYEQMVNYAWPGNVRELYNSIERAVVLSKNSKITPDDLMITNSIENQKNFNARGLKNSINLFKKNLIYNSLQENNWNQTKTAEQLRIARTYLNRLIKELKIEHE